MVKNAQIYYKQKVANAVKAFGLSKFVDCILLGNLVSSHQNTIHLQGAFCAKSAKGEFYFPKSGAWCKSKTWQLLHPLQN